MDERECGCRACYVHRPAFGPSLFSNLCPRCGAGWMMHGSGIHLIRGYFNSQSCYKCNFWVRRWTDGAVVEWGSEEEVA